MQPSASLYLRVWLAPARAQRAQRARERTRKLPAAYETWAEPAIVPKVTLLPPVLCYYGM